MIFLKAWEEKKIEGGGVFCLKMAAEHILLGKFPPKPSKNDTTVILTTKSLNLQAQKEGKYKKRRDNLVFESRKMTGERLRKKNPNSSARKQFEVLLQIR